MAQGRSLGASKEGSGHMVSVLYILKATLCIISYMVVVVVMVMLVLVVDILVLSEREEEKCLRHNSELHLRLI